MSGTETDPGPDQQFLDDVAAETPPQEAPPAAPEPQQKAPQTVPLAVLMEEREALRRERAERVRLQEQFDRGNQRLEQLIAGMQKQAAPPDPIPALETDPVGHFKRLAEEHQREIEELRQFKTRFEQQGQAQTQEQQIVGAYRADAMAFKAKTADFDPAYEHFKQTIYDMATQAGATPDQAISEVLSQEQRLVQTALRNGRSPAEVVYNTAKKWGFSAAPPAKPAERMDALQRGQQAARPAAGGARGQYEGLTIQELSAMSESDFANVPENIVKRILGG